MPTSGPGRRRVGRRRQQHGAEARPDGEDAAGVHLQRIARNPVAADVDPRLCLRAEQDDLSAEDRLHYLDIIETESRRLSKLSDNLLKLASLESDQVKFEPKPYRLDTQIRDLILACEPQWSGKGIEMDVALDEVSVTADEDLLSQVWINLLHNSIKFTPPGGSVRVALERRRGSRGGHHRRHRHRHCR